MKMSNIEAGDVLLRYEDIQTVMHKNSVRKISKGVQNIDELVESTENCSSSEFIFTILKGNKFENILKIKLSEFKKMKL